MIKKISSVLIACVAVLGLTSCGQKEGKAVYVLDNETLEKVLKEYKSVGDFHEGLAQVEKEVKEGETVYGFIDTKGEQVVAMNYLSTGDFSDGLAAVCKKVKEGDKEQNLWGYVNKNGEEVIAPAYSQAGEFADGLAVVVDKEGKATLVINEDGEKVYELAKDYTFDADAKYHDGLIPAKKSIKDGDKWGLLDKDGKEASKFIYESLGQFYDCGYAKATLNGTEFYIDTKENKYLKQDIKDEVNEELKWFNKELK